MRMKGIGSWARAAVKAFSCIVFFALGMQGCRKEYQEGKYEPPPLAFQGDSAQLGHTVIVPTLDTPAEEGKNVVWCASFQVAWNSMKDDVIKGPIGVKNAEVIADRLNQSEVSGGDLVADSYYAAAGRVGEGIIETISEDMATRFGGVTLPEFNAGPDWLVAYAYLKAEIAFQTPYFDQQGIFTDGSSSETKVSGFGLFEGTNEVNEKLAEQVEILYTSRKQADSEFAPRELEYYALDLCRYSKPCQVIVAHAPWADNLQEVVKDLIGKIEGWKGREREFGSIDELFVPNVNYDLTHSFRELIGPDKTIMNQGFQDYWIAEAFQRIEFKLDKSGALLASDAKVEAAAEPRSFVFDRPFLVMLRKRGAENPFFVMWVDNAELLCKTTKP